MDTIINVHADQHAHTQCIPTLCNANALDSSIFPRFGSHVLPVQVKESLGYQFGHVYVALNVIYMECESKSEYFAFFSSLTLQFSLQIIELNISHSRHWAFFILNISKYYRALSASRPFQLS